MNYYIKSRYTLFLLCFIFSGCGSFPSLNIPNANEDKANSTKVNETNNKGIVLIDDNGNLGDIFKNGSEKIGSVNKYLWQASLEVLNFLPITSVDPFSGIIVFGNGKAPGSSQIYNATVYISDPALSALSLNVTIRSLNGTISAAAKREVEDAILSRARQLKIKTSDF
jgi:hypothetical protein